jgi:hypothetical protein
MQTIKELRMYYLLEEVHLKRYTLEETPNRPGTSSRRLPSLSLYYYTKGAGLRLLHMNGALPCDHALEVRG